MSFGREEHLTVLAAARAAIAGVQEHLAVATDQAEVAIGLIDAAVGATPVESGRNALEFMAACKEKIEEAFRATQAAGDEARRYGEGF